MSLQIGNRGEAVRRLQIRLNQVGFNVGAADGIFGAKTVSGVKTLQRATTLAATGVFGVAEETKLRQVEAKVPTGNKGVEIVGVAPASNFKRALFVGGTVTVVALAFLLFRR
jgi:peptidoglycan hydrolase-like protein with peptidoglycan-binding domain